MSSGEEVQRNHIKQAHREGGCGRSCSFCTKHIPVYLHCNAQIIAEVNARSFVDMCEDWLLWSLSNRYCLIGTWCKSRRLQVNANKTEAIWFGSQANLASLNSLDCSLRVGLSTVQPSTVVRDLGLHLDNELSMKQHVTKVTATCYYHLCRLRQIQRHVGS